MEKKYDVLSLGEVLMRLSPPTNEKLTRGDFLEKQVGGAELNVLSGIALLGLKTGIISKVPGNDIGIFSRNKMRGVGISDEYLAYDNESDARLGLYYYENGAYPRKPRVVYDRKHSSMLKVKLEDFPEEMFTSTKWFHTTGITLALTPEVRDLTKELIKKFKAAGAKISFDVNFRSNLWTGPQAKQYIEEILPYVDMFFCSESTAQLTFLKEGTLEQIMKSFTEEYPISYVASTTRIVHSPKVHTFGSVFYDALKDTYYKEDDYANIEVVDRIGSGDAYISGALYGLIKYDGDCQKALEFGNATGAVKNTIPGDMQALELNEIEAIIASHQDTNDTSEMTR
ncbi:sugar kinase [Tannockella kyphosi]|uniref:sugar kinase n=1 Tax=Tannockella kyphosi TaxID=2899121 RepID=UPI0020122A06|nr:sugar kinase [Tannockella kyphosi]